MKAQRVIDAPAKHPSCCCIGGSRMDTMYITTADGAGLFAAQPA